MHVELSEARLFHNRLSASFVYVLVFKRLLVSIITSMAFACEIFLIVACCFVHILVCHLSMIRGMRANASSAHVSSFSCVRLPVSMIVDSDKTCLNHSKADMQYITRASQAYGSTTSKCTSASIYRFV